MDLKTFFSKAADRRFQVLAGIIILLGITFRLIMFFQNRDLIIDEANVVRNIYERGFIGLLKPLSYEQYAPPLYLWSLEICSYFFGYSETAMRLVALLCGIGSMFAFWWLLRKIMPDNSLWLPLGLLSFAPILIKYSTEVKQYGPDAFVAIILAGLAMNIDIFKTPKKTFVLKWMLYGSIAVWASQPSVFILAAIGFYYFTECALRKNWNFIPLLALIGLVWLAQFGVYYELILKAQINSGYLQQYHQEYFLFATPSSKQEWHHNWIRIRELLNNTAGYSQESLYLCSAFIVVGVLSLLRKSVSLFVLLCFPVMLTLLAAALNQFSLIERVVIFILPFIMLLAGLGFAQLMRIPLKTIQVIGVVLGINMLWNYNKKELFYEKALFQELTAGLNYILQNGGNGKEIYVDCASRDTYIYYTQIHPDKSKYARLEGAYLFDWEAENFKEIASKINTQRSFFIFTGGAAEQRKRHISEVKESLKQVAYFEFFYCYIFTFHKK